jgi:hypothetical protein
MRHFYIVLVEDGDVVDSDFVAEADFLDFGAEFVSFANRQDVRNRGLH